MKVPAHWIPDWTGRSIVIVANGTSMLDPRWTERLKTAQDARCIVMTMNGGGFQWPDSDVLMCTDARWLAANPDLSGYRGPEIIVTRPPALTPIAFPDSRMRLYRRQYIEHAKGDYFADKKVLVEGHTSVSTCIALAVTRRAERIVLVGLDLAPGPDGRRRTYDDSRDDADKARVRYAKQVQHLTLQASQVLPRCTVHNASPWSALTCYQYTPWEKLHWLWGPGED